MSASSHSDKSSSSDPDYFDRDALVSLGVDPETIASLLRATPLFGHGGRPVVASADLLDLLTGEEERDGGC
jgi:hypothetical protein